MTPARQEPEDATLHCTSTSRTHVGMVRQHNEDACLERPDLGLWAVADGMGGHSAGDVASRTIVQRLGALDAAPQLSLFVEQVEEILEAVNRELRELADERAASTIGSTVAALLVRRTHAVCLWAGDSRIYRLRNGKLEQVTQDHALVADLVTRGVLSAEQAANHPQSNLVTRAVGAGEALKLDMEIVTLRADDRFILCSDGLDKEVTEDELRAVAMRDGERNLADTLVALALERGSRDNVTVVTVDIRGDGSDIWVEEDSPESDADEEDTVPGFTGGTDRGHGTLPGADLDEVTLPGAGAGRARQR